MKVSVDWLHDFVKFSPPYEHIAERLTLAGLEVKKIHPVESPKDCLFEVEITTNRPDWLSHLGVAREVAAVENLSLRMPEVESSKNRQHASGWKINLKEAEGCPYYTGVIVEGITHFETPDFIKRRLEVCGLRTIDIIVDITNYVLLETGQPLHAFDADLICGKDIRVRRAKAMEKMIAINGRELELAEDDLVIADADRPVALAGVMGGKDTEVTAKTRNIFLESAFFHPRWIRTTGRKFSITSDSSYRFERRVDPEGVDFGRERALWLIQKYAKPRFISAVLKAGEKPAQSVGIIDLNAADIPKQLGVEIKAHQIHSILTRLGLHVTQNSSQGWRVKAPSFRPDLTRSIDLIEEIARIYGYENIPETLPEITPLLSEHHSQVRLENETRDFMSGIGLFETVTFSLVTRKGVCAEDGLDRAVSIVNPQNKELAWMRPSLLSSLLSVVEKNIHCGTPDVFIFEIANTYHMISKDKNPKENKTLGMVLSGCWKQKTWLDSARESSFYDLKGMLLSYFDRLGIRDYMFLSIHSDSKFRSEICEQIMVGADIIGVLGEVNPEISRSWDLESQVLYAEVDMGLLSRHMRWIKTFEELPRYPGIQRDIAVIVAETVKAGEIKEIIKGLGHGLIRDVEAFDLFYGGRIPKGFKNLGFRITYQSQERTLVSNEIQGLHTVIADKIIKKFQASFQ
ncbi:MAG: phenylalanine--tRNA ligase subunit beta [Candidatus Omnitrophica bacterium]|nr:phenylalanine--tRNA ligase subunit beta [Candidatus Omnitrophota bacterium]